MACSTTPAIEEAAQAFASSYARAMELSSHSRLLESPPTHRRSIISAALAAHYTNTTVFCLGAPPVTMATIAESTKNIATHLATFDKAGLGYDIFLEKSNIIPQAGGGSACCFLTWRIRPREGSGFEGWNWENLYVYRRELSQGEAASGEVERKVGVEGEEWDVPEGRWECILSDAEIAGLLERVPNFFELSAAAAADV